MTGTTPSAIILFAIEPRTAGDRERLDSGLRQLMAEDPTLRVHTDRESGKVIVAGMSEQHLEIVVERLTRELSVEAEFGKPQVIYKEAFTHSADGEGRFARQSGGRGQYAHAKIRLFPGEVGSGYVFENGLFEGSIPKQFIEPIDEGIREALTRGAMAGCAIDDVRVELYDGSYHDVDSSEMAFRIAGSMAFKDAALKAAPVLLEPVMRVEVVVPSDYADDVTRNLAKRRGAIESQENRGETQIINARISLSAMIGYATDLRLRTRARATCSIHFDRYEQCRVRPDIDDDDHNAPVRAPRTPAPKVDDSTMALPEPDEESPER